MGNFLINKRTISWRLHRALLDHALIFRPFSSRSGNKRLLIISETDPIARAQIFPFLYHAKDFSERHGIDIRELSLATLLKGQNPYSEKIDAVCFQTGFNLSRAEMNAIVRQIEANWPSAKLAYFDWFSPTDLRYADVLNRHISAYLKKHILKDFSQYGQPTAGDTNLCDYYSRRFDLGLPITQFGIPADFQEKLLVGGHFAFSESLVSSCLKPFAANKNRATDVHARIATQGSGWYTRMRQEALDHATALEGRLNVICRSRVPKNTFIQELNNSKMCFSPFGYGEVCWRDFEAMAAGSVLLKPDMSHLVCHPDVFFPDETYVSVAWDLSDLEEKIDFYLARPQERERIASNAFQLLHDYFHQGRFVADALPLLRRLELVT